MMRLIGILCLVTACAGIGCCRSAKLHEDVLSLERLCAMLDDAAACIRHQRLELWELLSFLAAHPNNRRFRFLHKVAEQLSPLTVPAELWKQAVMSDRAVPDAAKPILSALGAGLGTTDCEGQLAALSLYRGQLQRAAADAREIFRTKGKLCRTLGLLGGAMAAVVLA